MTLLLCQWIWDSLNTLQFKLTNYSVYELKWHSCNYNFVAMHLCSPAPEPFLYRIWHISLWFSELSHFSWLNQNGICLSCKGLHNLCITFAKHSKGTVILLNKDPYRTIASHAKLFDQKWYQHSEGQLLFPVKSYCYFLRQFA